MKVIQLKRKPAQDEGGEKDTACTEEAPRETTCALDVADKGEMSSVEIGRIFGISSTMVDFIVRDARERFTAQWALLETMEDEEATQVVARRVQQREEDEARRKARRSRVVMVAPHRARGAEPDSEPLADVDLEGEAENDDGELQLARTAE